MAESNLDERLCRPGRFTSPLLPFLQRTWRNMEHLGKLSLCEASFATGFCDLVWLHTTDSCGPARFHFFNRLEELDAKLLSTQSLITHFPIPHESTSGY